MSTMKRMLVIMRSVALSYILMVVLFMLYSMLLAYTNISESTIPTVVFVMTLISVFIGSSFSMIKFT